MSAVSGAAQAPEVAESAPRGFLRSAILSSPQAIVGVTIITIFVLVAVFGPMFIDDAKAQVGDVFEPPSGSHLLGTDGGGADMVRLLVEGSRISLIVGFAAAVVSALIGGVVGLASGFFGGKTDTVLMRITDYFIVIPDVPLMVVAAALFGRSLQNIILIIGVIYWTTTARLIRAQTLSVRERVYVRRSRALGAGNMRLIGKHVLPQVTPLLLANTVILVAAAIFAETFITFLGLGDPSLISWGRLIENSFTDDAILNDAWWTIVPPGVCVAIVVLALTMTGSAIEDALNPRLAVGHLSVRRFRMRVLPAAAGAALRHDAAAHWRRRGPAREGATMSEPALRVEELHVWFDLKSGSELHAVKGISFDLGRGERFGLVGESGCGKTTAILALMGLLPPNASLAGRVILDGDDILERGDASVSEHRWKDIAMVFQGAMNAFNPVKTVGAQIVEPMRLHEVAEGKAAWARAGELLETVGIAANRAHRYPHEFSGGMRQRAAIAMSLACKPQVLLADEPTTALDVMVQAQILELLVGLAEDFGLALVLVTHDLPVVAQVCDRAAVMYGGEFMEVGPINELYHDPRHPYTRLLFAATPDLHGEGEVVSIPGAPPRLDRDIPGCPFAPRCDRTFEPCPDVKPRRLAVGQEHIAACHLNDPALAEAS